MRYVLALVITGTGVLYILGNDGGPVDERLGNASTATVSSGYSGSVSHKAPTFKPIAENQNLTESVVGADVSEQVESLVDQASSSDSAAIVFDLGPFIDPEDMSTWPEGQEVIVGEYIDPDEFFAEGQPPIEIGEWIDPDDEYGSDTSDPIEIGDYEDPENPTPSRQSSLEIGEFIDPDNP